MTNRRYKEARTRTGWGVRDTQHPRIGKGSFVGPDGKVLRTHTATYWCWISLTLSEAHDLAKALNG